MYKSKLRGHLFGTPDLVESPIRYTFVRAPKGDRLGRATAMDGLYKVYRTVIVYEMDDR